MSDIIAKAAEALGVDPTELKKDMLAELLGDLSPAKKDETPERTTEEKLDALAKEVSELTEAFKGAKDKSDDAEKDDAEKAKGKGKLAPPFKPGNSGGTGGDDEEEDDEEKSKAKAKKDAEGGDEKPVTKSEPLPWPKDMASKSFRAGEIQKRDEARDWGRDPWHKTG